MNQIAAADPVNTMPSYNYNLKAHVRRNRTHYVILIRLIKTCRANIYFT